MNCKWKSKICYLKYCFIVKLLPRSKEKLRFESSATTMRHLLEQSAAKTSRHTHSNYQGMTHTLSSQPGWQPREKHTSTPETGGCSNRWRTSFQRDGSGFPRNLVRVHRWLLCPTLKLRVCMCISNHNDLQCMRHKCTSHHEWQVFGKFTVGVISSHLNAA